jgi:hypothetical protein
LHLGAERGRHFGDKHRAVAQRARDRQQTITDLMLTAPSNAIHMADEHQRMDTNK